MGGSFGVGGDAGGGGAGGVRIWAKAEDALLAQRMAAVGAAWKVIVKVAVSFCKRRPCKTGDQEHTSTEKERAVRLRCVNGALQVALALIRPPGVMIQSVGTR